VNYVAETVCDYVSVLSKHEHNVAFANNVEVITNHFLRCQTTHAVPCGTRASSCRDRPTFQRGRIQKGPLHVLRGAWGLDPILEIQCGKTHSKGFKVVAEIANGDRHPRGSRHVISIWKPMTHQMRKPSPQSSYSCVWFQHPAASEIPSHPVWITGNCDTTPKQNVEVPTMAASHDTATVVLGQRESPQKR